MKLGTLALLCVLAALVSAGAVYWAVSTHVLDRVGARTQSVEYVFYVNETLGIDAASDKLRLGAVRPGARARRNVSFTDAEASVVTAQFSGPGSQWLRAEPSRARFVNGSASLRIVVEPARGAAEGRYTGSATFYIR